MWRVGVWEQSEGIAALVKELTGERGSIKSGEHPALLSGELLDLLIVSPMAVGWAGAAALHCRTVLLPDGAGPLARSLLADRAVSYGMNPRDTITVSSLDEEHICIAVQRELVRLDGNIVEQQELVVRNHREWSPEMHLVRAGVRLLLGNI